MNETIHCNVKANEDIIARILQTDAVGEEYFCIEPDGTLLVDLPIATEKVNRINLLNSETHVGSMYYAESEDESDIPQILKFIDDIEKEHPYKVCGMRESYSQYNEAWNDALDRVRGLIESL